MPEVELYARTNGELLLGPAIPDKTRLLEAAIARLLLPLIEIDPYEAVTRPPPEKGYDRITIPEPPFPASPPAK